METNKIQWKRIAKGEKLPCTAMLMKEDGTISTVATCAGVVVGQDAYYLPVEELRSFPKEESEDEMIRKALIQLVKKAGEGYENVSEGVSIQKAIAWLEKQGKNNMGISEATKQKLEDSLNKALEKETPESYNKFLDEQGVQKPIKTCAEYYNKDRELIMPVLSEFQDKLADILMHREYDGPDETEDDIAKGRLEYELAAIRLSEELLPLAQKEQKPANKVKPKFKVGDWIIYKDSTWKVCNISLLNYYELLKINNEVSTRRIEDVDKTAHLWTIKDAKDGDVLSYRDGQWIFIYKEKIDDSSFHYHILYSTIHQDLTTNDSAFTLLSDAIIPATKKQRDLLFQKMKEAGFEFS